MIKLMLVDDKKDLIYGIESMHSWKEDGIEIVAKAYDGKMALEQYKLHSVY